MADLTRELAAFEQMRQELERVSAGKWVVFQGSELVGVFDSLNAAAQAAVRLFGRGPYLIRQVGALPVTLPASMVYHPIYGEDDAVRFQELRDRAR
ncbi:MAG TPA: hypothetical protein VFQ90_12895 [Stellaceae bacterium]|jgi:hypothetical protein|nr:hypothetical protein [Stellaceae bacterium]